MYLLLLIPDSWKGLVCCQFECLNKSQVKFVEIYFYEVLKQFNVSTAVSFCHAETSQRPSACCLKTSEDRISIKRVLGYTVQEAGVCPINAIV